MRVFIANFGKGNWAWQNCLDKPAIAVMDDVRLHPYWQKGDQENYIREALKIRKNATKNVASRWYNLNTILMETSGDLWTHLHKKELWWTISTDAPAEFEIIPDPNPPGDPSDIYVYYKQCLPWSYQDKKGGILRWNNIHPRAKDFLSTVGTFSKLSDDLANYTKALIEGNDLSYWHDRPEWKSKFENSKRKPGTNFSPHQLAIATMTLRAQQAAQESCKEVTTIRKNKEFRFKNARESEKYLKELLEEQEGICKLTGLQMTLDEDQPELHYSLDRIDSNGHYERGNLQVVCKFANRWKNDDNNQDFLDLIIKIRSTT